MGTACVCIDVGCIDLKTLNFGRVAGFVRQTSPRAVIGNAKDEKEKAEVDHESELIAAKCALGSEDVSLGAETAVNGEVELSSQIPSSKFFGGRGKGKGGYA